MQPAGEAMPDFLEHHYTLGELAKQWHMSRGKVDEWFRDVPDIIRFGVGKLTKSRKRTYMSVRVPESVARRVYRERTRRDPPPTPPDKQST